jgi:WD repeat-containing protein 35
LANDYENLANAFYKLEDFGALEALIESLPQASPILEKLGEKFMSMGLCKEAVDSFVKFGEVKRAIDCCVLLN